MANLNQLVAVLSGKKTKTQEKLTALYKEIQAKSELFDGLTRTYKPIQEDGETFPPENKNIVLRADELLKSATSTFIEVWDVVATIDEANTAARADIKVGEKVVLSGVPVTTLLYLEKQLDDLHSVINHLPTLNPSEKWVWDSNSNAYRSEVTVTNKTKKTAKPFIKYEATKEHPAQVDVVHEDIKTGEWIATKFSSAIPIQKKNEMLNRVVELKDAVKFAREEANKLAVVQKNVGKSIVDYVVN